MWTTSSTRDETKGRGCRVEGTANDARSATEAYPVPGTLYPRLSDRPALFSLENSQRLSPDGPYPLFASGRRLVVLVALDGFGRRKLEFDLLVFAPILLRHSSSLPLSVD